MYTRFLKVYTYNYICTYKRYTNSGQMKIINFHSTVALIVTVLTHFFFKFL